MVKKIPNEFKKEYKKYLNKEITRQELCTMFNVSSSTINSWVNKLELPTFSRTKNMIPSTFKESYMEYLRGKITSTELYTHYNISCNTVLRWRDACNLPMKDSLKSKDISEFSKVYPRYLSGELKKSDIFEMFNIREATFQKWVGELDLAIKTGRFKAIEIPENFEDTYNLFLQDKISKPKLLKELGISDRTLYKWVKEKKLPLKRTSKGVLKTRDINKSTFSFSLFGYEFSFKAKKKEPSKSVNLSDKFPDEIEY